MSFSIAMMWVLLTTTWKWNPQICYRLSAYKIKWRAKYLSQCCSYMELNTTSLSSPSNLLVRFLKAKLRPTLFSYISSFNFIEIYMQFIYQDNHNIYIDFKRWYIKLYSSLRNSSPQIYGIKQRPLAACRIWGALSSLFLLLFLLRLHILYNYFMQSICIPNW